LHRRGHEHIDAAPRSLDLRDTARYGFSIREVITDREGAGLAAECSGKRARGGCRAAIRERDVSAFRGERVHDGAADSAGTTGHQYALACEPEIHGQSVMLMFLVWENA